MKQQDLAEVVTRISEKNWMGQPEIGRAVPLYETCWWQKVAHKKNWNMLENVFLPRSRFMWSLVIAEVGSQRQVMVW